MSIFHEKTDKTRKYLKSVISYLTKMVADVNTGAQSIYSERASFPTYKRPLTLLLFLAVFLLYL